MTSSPAAPAEEGPVAADDLPDLAAQRRTRESASCFSARTASLDSGEPPLSRRRSGRRRQPPVGWGRRLPARVGELRPNQLLHTYGVGAVTDLPNLSVVVPDLTTGISPTRRSSPRTACSQPSRHSSAPRSRRCAPRPTSRRPPTRSPSGPGSVSRSGSFRAGFAARIPDATGWPLSRAGLFALLDRPTGGRNESASSMAAGATAPAGRPRCPPDSCSRASVATWTTSRGCSTCTTALPPSR